MRYRLRTLPRIVLPAVVSLCCLYLPFAWLPFTWTPGWTLDSTEWTVAVITLPGHVVASKFMGAQWWDFYTVAGIITVGLLTLGVRAGRRDEYSLAVANFALLSWSLFVSQWLWHQFDWLTTRWRF